MDAAALGSGIDAGTKLLGKFVRFARGADTLSVAEKVYSIAGFLAIVTTFLLVMSIQSVRLQTTYRHMHASSAEAAINIGRINALIYAVVMESRGIYMSADRGRAKPFADALLQRNRELAEVVKGMEATIGDDDAELFSTFRQRIAQFIDFRQELVRRGLEISTAAAREWGDNDANRTLRSKLNSDIEALARIYRERAREADELANENRYAAAYLFALGLAALLLAGLNVVVMRGSVVGALSDITQATDRIAAGDVKSEVPHLRRHDEIGHLARAVQNFRDAVARIFELEELELGTAQARDAAMTERDKFNDKYQAKKWQLSAAITSMPQGLIMLDGKTSVVAMNSNYRRIYNLPETIQAGSTLEEILQHRVRSGLFSGDVTKYVAAVRDRIARREPAAYEINLNDGRTIKIYERPMDGGGWVSVQEDVTEQRQQQRILERMERFLATIIENVAEGIIAKDARNLRYVFVNRAAEKMIGMSRAEIIGKTARELFSAEAAELIERRDQQLLAQKQQLEPIVDTIDNPVRGRRVICARRIQIGGAGEESHMFVTMVEDRTEKMVAAA
ncbi:MULTISPECIES: PAS-domain containing protein [unclassified Bradyrhizobium]|uniref:PAS-domain containing protein n=1 Tax=unclassified Bradyrhizobium TaxID=2631580 RepID=UPI002479B14E|nr:MULTISPECIES: PAS-domain containing protein [unclassified Bradyrhizobium]WGR74228.1 PAS-domain containing protein [Bradyrhizobium sp. ISRA426]WGR79063.1 PAS-domain containing protein [Bradyrhizobium sp. ISRA430]WGR89467.1 PAS-domain containing protein [Bradyrhizobium sp. ISRA432]